MLLAHDQAVVVICPRFEQRHRMIRSFSDSALSELARYLVERNQSWGLQRWVRVLSQYSLLHSDRGLYFEHNPDVSKLKGLQALPHAF